ncbi:metallophosphoesterase [Candidatus Poribacteria bacterium]
MRSKQKRRIALLLILGMTFWTTHHAAIAHVDGSHGLAPELPPEVPGVDRPFPQDEDKFTFAIIGDKTGGGERNWPIFDRAMDEVSYIHPDLAIIVGDLIQGYTTDTQVIDEQWKEFYQHANLIQVPLFFLPGNHDITNKLMYEYWSANIGKTYYSFSYKECHFILLNTEEGWRNDEIGLGSEQMEWVRSDIEAHGDSKHIFFFMHRPAWHYSGEGFAQWETIESWLEGLPYTVFAGHFHNLSYEKRKDHRYFVLSSTGAGMSPWEVLELGAFHHYTLVTVDGQDVHIAVTQPGSIHSYDVATREFVDKVRQLLTWESFPIVQGASSGELIARINNLLAKPVTIEFEYSPPDESLWDFAPRAATYVVRPGDTAELAFKASYDFENPLPLPSYGHKMSYGDKQLQQGTTKIEPQSTAIAKWMVVGPFDLGTQETPPDTSKLDTAPPAFVQALEPEKNWDTTATYLSGTDTIAWQEEETAENGLLDFDSIYGGDYALAYALCYIHAPDNRKVLTAFKGDDLSKVFVDGLEVYSSGYSGNLNYFMLPLHQGWNTVTVKCADYASGWGYTLKIADPDEELEITIQK